MKASSVPGPQHKSRNHAVEHVGACVVADDAVSFSFYGCAKHIVGGRLSIGAADDKDILLYLSCQFFQYSWAYL